MTDLHVEEPITIIREMDQLDFEVNLLHLYEHSKVRSHVVSSADLDVTLLVCLLRNLPPQVSPSCKGFDVLPHSTDLSPGAHIARIKYYKNFLVSHSKDGKLVDVDFNTIWIDLEMAIHGLGNQQDVTAAADAKSKVLDYKTINELMMIDKRIIDHNIELAEHTTRIAQLETTVEKAHLTKKDIAVRRSKGGFNEFKDELMRSTILDEEVLDILISKCVLILDDKDEIDSFPDQSSRNNKLLEILMHRPYHTFTLFVEALKESDQKCHIALVANMMTKVTDKSLTLQHVQHKEDITELKSAGITPREKSRGLLQNIINRNASSAYATFLDVLREDICYQEYATKIEETDVTQFDLDLLHIGRLNRERKREKKKENQEKERNDW
ncbi:unnamed protein product [Mytilus edulis]|uniref:CARD domain-containing protein n=1 Tax=Mytilus edulis TaxID=6550 RepID=A0A8S3R9W0_MYTED|nr:unnamed protein product [Mytilus edulis]